MPQFSHREYFPGLYHITDPLGVQFTLIVPHETGKALLFDAGYGVYDLRPYIGELLKKHRLGLADLTVLISHAHYDHMLGVRWFDSFRLHPAELPVFKVYREEKYLRGVLVNKAPVLGPDFDERSFLEADYAGRAVAEIPALPGIDILHIPGHTPGSLVLYVRENKLILTADDWNPTTWLFFPEALPVTEYARNMRSFLSLDFDHVLCSHSPKLIPGDRLRDFIRGLNAETFAGAEPAETPYPEIPTLQCRPEPETNFVFRKPCLSAG